MIIYNGGGGNPGGRPPSGGGTTGSKGFNPSSAIPFSENGGFAATNFFLMVPTQQMVGGAVGIAIYDTTSYDDPNDASSYSYRIEDVIPGRMPTVRRVILNYRDLGPALLTVAIDGTDDNQQPVVQSVKVQLGNTVPTLEPMIKLVDITVTCFQPQLTLSRAAGGGPIDIISATLVGEVEEVSL